MSWQNHRSPPVVDFVAHRVPARLAALHGTRIVHISDLHVGRYFRAETWAQHVRRINGLAPDVVVITGDAMDWSRRYEADYIEPLRALEPRIVTLAILGNHDFYFGAKRLARTYQEQAKVCVLRGGMWHTDALPGLFVWGIDDPMSRLNRPATYPELAGMSSQLDPVGYHVLLSHRPDAFPYASKAGFDLQLSGHTHGGQLSIETAFGTLHPAQIFGPYDRGHFELPSPRGRSSLYVSRGLGFTGIPYRYSCPTEITVHELVVDGLAPPLAVRAANALVAQS